jgi:glucokinase
MELLGIDIGGSKCTVVLGTVEKADTPEITATIVDRTQFPTQVAGGAKACIQRITDSATELLKKNNWRSSELEGIGISCGGPLDSRLGLVLSPPNLPGWDSIPITQIMKESFKVDARLENDANVCALAEWKFGAARGLKNVVFLTFGTGMGAGLILDGRLYRGTNDLGGEVGHVRLEEEGPVGYGKAGSFEGFCSGGGIANLAKQMVRDKLQAGEKVAFCADPAAIDSLDAQMIADAAQSGDPLAREVLAVSGRHLGMGLSMLVDILNPEAIVIGGIFARCRGLLWPSAHEVMKRECLPSALERCRVVSAELGEAIGDYAALCCWLDQ